MAVTSRQVEFAQEGDVRVGRVVDHVEDADTGLVAERERLAVQVPTEYGGTATVVGERSRAVHVPHWIQDSALTGGRGESSGRGGSLEDESKKDRRTQCFCFLPFTSSKICVVILRLVLLIVVAVLTTLTAAGPVHCSDLVAASGTTFALLGVIALIVMLCWCFARVANSKDKSAGTIRGCVSCWSCLAAVAFVGLVISSSAVVFADSAMQAVTNGDCSLAAAPIVTVAFSYSLFLLFFLFWCCTCCCRSSKN